VDGEGGFARVDNERGRDGARGGQPICRNITITKRCARGWGWGWGWKRQGEGIAPAEVNFDDVIDTTAARAAVKYKRIIIIYGADIYKYRPQTF
jgi:hypothetical protein